MPENSQELAMKLKQTLESDTPQLTSAQRKLIELDRMKDVWKRWHEDLKQAIEEVVEEGHTHFQDPEDGTVFQIVEPKGRYVYFERYGYERTRREGEARGSLSLKAAKELGYEISTGKE